MIRYVSVFWPFILLLTSCVAWADDISVEPSRVDFGQVPIETVKRAEVFVFNEDDDRITINGIRLRDERDGTFFIVDDECSDRRLNPLDSCRFIVGFYPLAERSYSSSIDVIYDGDDRERVRVSGEGVRISEPPPPVEEPPPPVEEPPPPVEEPPPPVEEPPPGSDPPAGLSLSVDAEEVAFGEVYLGTRINGNLILINSGGVPLVLGEIVPSPSWGDPFSLRSDGCSERTLQPGGRCSLRIEFLPWEAGTYTERLDVPYGEEGRAPLKEQVFVTGNGYVESGNSPPDIPVLIHPLPDQDNLRTSVTFRWERCEDPDGDQVGYWVFYSEDPRFLETVPARLEPGRTRLASFALGALALLVVCALPVRRRLRLFLCILLVLSMAAACSDDIEDNATVPAFNLEARTTYYWKVVAEDGRGGLAESEVRTFTTR